MNAFWIWGLESKGLEAGSRATLRFVDGSFEDVSFEEAAYEMFRQYPGLVRCYRWAVDPDRAELVRLLQEGADLGDLIAHERCVAIAVAQ